MDGQRALLDHATRNGVDIREGRLKYGSEGEYLNYIVGTARPGAEWRRKRDEIRAGAAGSTFGEEEDDGNGNSKTRDRVREALGSTADLGDYNGNKCIGVMLPGWGSGVSLYTYILPALVDSFREIYCVDLPGMGLSSRPAFPSIADGTDASVEFFCGVLNSAFRNLFDECKCDAESGDEGEGAIRPKRVLIAHSMGAYIACRWHLQDTYDLFDSFVMISPAGISTPDDVGGKGVKNYDNDSDYVYSSRDIPAINGPLARVIDWCWRREITPQSILRVIPNSIAFFACRKYLQWRSPDLAENSQLLTYLYQVSRQNSASGETALCTLFYPGLWARQPLLPLVAGISIPTMFIYGDKDLMDSNDGIKAAANMEVKTTVKVLKNSSHCPFIDNVSRFSEDLLCALQKMNS